MKPTTTNFIFVHISVIEDVYNKKSEEAKRKSNPFGEFIREWRTMQEWGINGSPAKRRPNISDLLNLCERVNKRMAADYIRVNLLGRKSIFCYLFTRIINK